MKRQVVVIHGGGVFDTYKEYIAFLKSYKLDFERLKLKGWKGNLSRRLGKDFEVISPRMPNSMDAKYKEWKIMFEKLFPFLKNNLVLLGHSLGGIFLVKYLSENKFPKRIRATFLVAAPQVSARFKRPNRLTPFFRPRAIVSGFCCAKI